MPSCIAFLRPINVGTTSKLAVTRLLSLRKKAGLTNPRIKTRTRPPFATARADGLSNKITGALPCRLFHPLAASRTSRI